MEAEERPVALETEATERTVEPGTTDTAGVTVAPAGTAIRPRRGVLTAVWIAAVAGLALFLALGTASIQAGSFVRFRRSVPLSSIWSRFVEELADGGSATLVRVGLFSAAAVLLAGSALGLWLAMTADAGKEGPSEPGRA